MEWLVDNWVVVVSLVALLFVAVIIIVAFFRKPTDEQLGKVKEWLLWAVTNAEAELKDGTGQLKLRMVYDQFVVRFPGLYKFISFDTFSHLVDEALIDMRNMLETNPKVAALVAERKTEPLAILLTPEQEEGM